MAGLMPGASGSFESLSNRCNQPPIPDAAIGVYLD